MKSPQRSSKQNRNGFKIADCILIIFTGLEVTYHTWLALTRHMWAKENSMLQSPTFVKLLNADFYLTVAFLAYVLLWFAVGRFMASDIRNRQKAVLKCFCAPDTILMLALFIWYLVTNLAYSDKTNQLVSYMRYELDAGICAVILFPLGKILGPRKMKRFLDVVFHLILAFSTVAICIMLFNLLSGRKMVLYNTLSVYVKKKTGRVYFGTNENIAAMIGLTMVYICLYLFFIHRHRVGRIIYAVLMFPHVFATLATGSRACFLALLITLPAAAALFVWTHLDRPDARRRLLLFLAAFAVGIICIWVLRSVVALIFKSSSGNSFSQKSLFKDTGRLPIWNASLHMMIDNAKQFTFGIPKLRIPEYIEKHITQLYGSGSSYAHAHNQILQVGCAQGVPAMFAYIAFLLILAIRSLKIVIMEIKKRSKRGFLVIPICLFGMMLVNMFEPFIWLYFSVMGCVFFLLSGLLYDAEKELSSVDLK